MGWTAPMQPLLTSKHPPIGADPLTDSDIAWLGSIIYIGSIVGTSFWGLAADQLGRKVTALLVAVPYLASWILILVANSTTWLLVARFISGLSYSGTMVAVVAFISETAQDNLRGFLGSFFVVLISLGVLYTYIIGAYLKYYGLAISCLIIPIVFLMTFSWFPETPMFLWKKGQIAKAQQSLLWYRGGDTVEAEKTLLKYKTMTNTQNKQASLKALVATQGTIKAIIIGIALVVAMQGCGAFTILSFSVHIFEMSGTSLTTHQSAITIAIAQLVASIFCSVLVDRLGRKILLVGSLILMALALALFGCYLYFFKDKPVDSVLSWIPVVSLSVHVLAFAGGLGPVSNIVKGEIFAHEVRGLAISLLQLLNGLLAFAVIAIFPIIKALLGLHGCFWLYSCSCILFSVYFIIHLPETKNKPLISILKILNNEDLNANNILEEGEQLSERPQQSETTNKSVHEH